MFRVQDHRHIKRIHHHVVGYLTECHIQEVGRVSEVCAGLDELLSATAALVVGDDRRELREKRDRLGEVRRGARVRGIRVVGSDHADGGAHNVHRMRGQRQVVDDAPHVGVEGTLGALELLELGELRGRREFTVPKQVGDLLERLLGRQLLHRVAAVEQRVGVGVHLRDGRVVDRNAGESLVDFFVLEHAHSFVLWGSIQSYRVLSLPVC